MIRYDLIVKKVNGCASARVEKHEVGSFVKYVDVMEHITELEKERAVRDLEQQAKGLEDYVSKTMDNSYILHLDPEDIHHCILINLNATALRLLERAKALKEQE